MPAPLPVSEQITQQVLATLEGVTTALGYQIDLVPQRRLRRTNAPGPYVAVLSEGHDREMEPKPPYTGGNGSGDGPYGTKAWLRYYEVEIYVFDSDDDPTAPFGQLCDVARAEVERAVMADPQRAGLAADTFVRDPAYFVEANEVAGICVAFEVQYRTVDADPYTKA